MSKSQVTKVTKIYGEVLSYEMTNAICRFDAPTVASDIDAYVQANAEQYYIAINAWLLLCEDLTGNPRLSMELADVIRVRGLLATVKSCDKLAGNVIKMLSTGDTPANDEADVYLGNLFTSIEDYNLLLMALRFLKRFTITKADKLLDSALDAIVDLNRSRSVPRCDYLEDRIRDYLIAMIGRWYISSDDAISFSSGVCQGARTLSEKLKSYSRFEKYWISPLYPIGDHEACESWPKLTDPLWDEDVYYAVTLQAVPKSYKTYRIIAPERAYEAAHMQAIRKEMERRLHRSKYGMLFDPTNQDPNRELAFNSSIDGRYATMDLSSASDSISYELMQRVLPPEWLKVLDKYRATYLKIKRRDGYQILTSNIFLTSGNPCTFVCEGMLFLAIYLACGDIWSLFNGGEKPLAPHIFGDDGICDVRVFPTIVDALTRLGFTVNEEKSYASGQFRESCGVEFWNGLPVHHEYWPRKEVKPNTPEGIGELCALQHRVFNHFLTEKFLSRVVEAYWPDMTSSYPGTDCFDLWSRNPRYGKRCAPMPKGMGAKDSGIPAELCLREAHYALTEKSRNLPDVGTLARDTLESYLYASFLKNGPYYATPLDALLGVSTKHAVNGSEEKPLLELRKVIR